MQGRIQRGGKWGWSPPTPYSLLEPPLQFLAMNEEEEEEKMKKEEGKQKKEEHGKLNPFYFNSRSAPN